MPSLVAASGTPSASRTEFSASGTRVLLMDIETLVKDRRTVLRDAIEYRFRLSGHSAHRRLFYSVGLAGSAEQIARLFAKKLAVNASPAADVANDIKAYYASDKVRKAEGAEELLSRNRPVVLITWLDPETAQALLRALELEAPSPSIFSTTPGNHFFPDSAAWEAATRAENFDNRGFVALVDNEAACRDALAAGIPCLAAPDEWTSYQDFGGSIRVLSNLKEAAQAADSLRGN